MSTAITASPTAPTRSAAPAVDVASAAATTSPTASGSPDVAPPPPAAPRRDPTDEVAVAQLMAGIAAGDTAAIWSFHEMADVPVRSRLRGELRRLGVRYEAEDLDALVVDAVLAIADVAPSWRPGGAPPWSWAHHRVVGVVHRFVGTFADSLDELGDGDAEGAIGWLEAHAMRSPAALVPREPAEGPDGACREPLAALRRLATVEPWAAELDAALSATTSARDIAVWFATLDERAAGNASPALTVGTRFGLRAATVRQVVHRVWSRVEAATADDRYPALAALPLFAERGQHRELGAG